MVLSYKAMTLTRSTVCAPYFILEIPVYILKAINCAIVHLLTPCHNVKLHYE